MVKYTWAIDGGGNAFICLRESLEIVLCMINGCSGIIGVMDLEEQNDTI